MSGSRFRVEKLSPLIGAEILDVDVNALSDDDLAEIRRLWVDNQVIFFRDQRMSPVQHRDFAQRFGELAISHNPRIRHPEVPEISVHVTDENSKNAVGDMWHTDGSGDPCPPMGSMLYMHQIPPDGGGDTMFASSAVAYEKLSEPLKRFLEGLTAVHDRVYAMRSQFGVNSQQPGDGAPVSRHPVIRTHPETGRRGIYVNRAWTSHIVELEKAESDALLQMLFNHIEQPIFTCRFRWQPNSIAFWDNRLAQHLPLWDYFPHRRFAHRITIVGDRPFFNGGISNASEPKTVRAGQLADA